ncbi:MAG TPA: adenylate/guanylate cyclase domain-containing protein [Burkholderiales bacterium]|nr:adenylate/guanylate cyclase domain-containing protein [Burkholderiales bacterium]
MTTHRDWLTPCVFALGVWLAALALGNWRGLGTQVEYPFLDWNLRQATRAAPDPDIVILDIDEPTLEAMAPEYGRYPWTRAVYGALIEGLAHRQVKAIVFDILLVDPHKEHAQDDLYLIRAAQRAPAFFPMARLKADDTRGALLKDVPGIERGPTANDAMRAALLLPLPGLTATGRIGTIDVEPDADAVIRRYPLYRDIGGWRVPSLPVRVAKELGYTVPAENSLMLVWHGAARSYRTVSLHDVLFDLERQQSRRARGEFAGKIVIIGASAPGLSDLKLTPIESGFPGTEVIATAIDNLKRGERVRTAPTWSAPLTAAIVLALLAVAFARGANLLYVGLGLLGGSLVLAVGATLSMAQQRYAVPIVGPLAVAWLYYVALSLRAWLIERQDRQRVTQLFGRFLDPRVVSELVDSGGADASAVGQRRNITVLFSDIRGFTTLSERQTPKQVVELLNRYFRLQVEVIFRHQGTLDKYIGDAIMAFWGAPAQQPDHARRALAAAREMEQVVLRFKQELGERGRSFDIGIGLNSGEVVVGFVGSPEHRQDYTVIGDTVNTASRIEGATKGRARILVSAATRLAAGKGVSFRDHGQVALKGKEEKTHLYEPLWGDSNENPTIDNSRGDGRGTRAVVRRRARRGNR